MQVMLAPISYKAVALIPALYFFLSLTDTACHYQVLEEQMVQPAMPVSGTEVIHYLSHHLVMKYIRSYQSCPQSE